MKDGPVPSKIDDIFKAVRGDSFFASDATVYAKLFSVHDWFLIEPKMDANLDYLSQSDLEELDASLSSYGHLSWDEVRERSHDYAWRVTTINKPIDMRDIMRENGEKEDYIAHVCEHVFNQRPSVR